jgi:3-oxoacyl-[acyl-carrier-protein] synthase III
VTFARISGLGAWLPETVRENSAWPPDFAARTRRSEKRELVDLGLETGTPSDHVALRHFAAEMNDPFLGTTRRRIADDRLTAPEAEANAARAALADAGLHAREIDVVISYSAVPERILPPGAPKVAWLLGATRARALSVDAACASTIAALDVATAMVEARRATHVLVTQSHLMTRLFPLLHPASPNVGDAAAAFVVSAADQPGILAIRAQAHGEYYDAVTYCRDRVEDPPWWQPGAGYYLGSRNRQQAEALVLQTVRIATETVLEVLAQANVPLQTVEALASVQPRGWVPGAIVETLGGTMRAPQTFDELAHLGGAGVILNLLEARRLGHVRSGSRVVLYAQGAGFVRGAALVEL